MSPVTHFLTGWLAANIGQLENRDRTLVTMSVVIPDIDGLGSCQALSQMTGKSVCTCMGSSIMSLPINCLRDCF